MFRIFIGRIICVVTVLLMVTGFSLSMNNVSEVKLTSAKIKKLTYSISQNQDVDPFTYTEMEEMEDFEECEDYIFLNSYDFNTFIFPSIQLIEINHSDLSKCVFVYYDKKSDFKSPKWLTLKKIII